MTQVHAIEKQWTKIADSSANLHVKIPRVSKVFYVVSSSDPSGSFPQPTDADEIKILVTPKNPGFINFSYTGTDPIWMYSTHSDLYVIVE